MRILLVDFSGASETPCHFFICRCVSSICLVEFLYEVGFGRNEEMEWPSFSFFLVGLDFISFC